LHSRISSLENKNPSSHHAAIIQQGDSAQVQQTSSKILTQNEPPETITVTPSSVPTVSNVPSPFLTQDNLVNSPSDSTNDGSPPELINHTQTMDLSITGVPTEEEDENSYNSTFSEETATELPFGVNSENVRDQEGVQQGNVYNENNHQHPDILAFCEKQIEKLEDALNKTISNFNKKSKEHVKEHRSIDNRIVSLSKESEKTMTSLSHHFDERLLKNHQVLSQKIDDDFEVMNVFRAQTNSALDSINNLAKKTSDLVLNLNNEIKTGEAFKDLSQSISQAVDDVEEIKTSHSLLEAQLNRQDSEIYHEIGKLKEELDIKTDSTKNLSQLIQELPGMISSVVQSVSSASRSTSIFPNENPFSSKFVRNFFYPPLVSKLVIAGQGGLGPQALESAREFISRIISIFKTVYVLPDNGENFDNLKRLFESCLEGEALLWARNQTAALEKCRDLPFCGPFDSPEKVLLVNVPTQVSDTENGKRFSYLELFLMRFVPFVGPEVFDSYIANEISREVKRKGDGNYLSAKQINDLIQRYSNFLSISAALKFKIFSSAIDPVLFGKIKNYEEYTKHARLQTQSDFDWIVNKVIDRPY